MHLSNLRTSIFYLQQTLREDKYKENEKLSKALNLLAEVELNKDSNEK